MAGIRAVDCFLQFIHYDPVVAIIVANQLGRLGDSWWSEEPRNGRCGPSAQFHGSLCASADGFIPPMSTSCFSKVQIRIRHQIKEPPNQWRTIDVEDKTYSIWSKLARPTSILSLIKFYTVNIKFLTIKPESHSTQKRKTRKSFFF